MTTLRSIMEPAPISRRVGRHDGADVYEALAPRECDDCGRRIFPGEYFAQEESDDRRVASRAVCSTCRGFASVRRSEVNRRRVWSHSNRRNQKTHHIHYRRKHHRRPRR